MTEQQNRTGSGFGSTLTSRRVVLLGVLGVAMGCGGGGQGGRSAQQTPGGTGTGTAAGGTGTAPSAVDTPVMVRGRKANFHGEASVIGRKSITVDMYDFYFEPTVLVGSPGQRVTVNLLNEGQVAHTFTIESQNVDVVLQPGQRGSTEVGFPQSGQHGFVCRFHIAQGMLGLLITRG